MKNKNVGGGLHRKNGTRGFPPKMHRGPEKICMGRGSRTICWNSLNLAFKVAGKCTGGHMLRKICVGVNKKKIWGDGRQKIKILERGSAKFSIVPPPGSQME